MAISAEFTADFSQFTSAAQGAQEALTGVTTAADQVGGNVDEQSRKAGQAIRDFGSKVKDFATDYIKAFAEEEAATARLTSALEASGHAAPAVIAQYQAMAEQFQTTTRYSDDAVTAAQTALTTIGKIGPEQMAPAIQAAADLAARLGIGLPEAATKLATVIGSDGAKLGTLNSTSPTPTSRARARRRSWRSSTASSAAPRRPTCRRRTRSSRPSTTSSMTSRARSAASSRPP